MNKNVPKIRFVEFKEEWVQKKFSSIVNRISNQSSDPTLPKVEFEDIVSGEGILNKDISQKFDDRKGTVFEPNFILFGKLRPYLKNWLFPDFKGIALGDFWVFEANNSSPLFNFYLIQSDKYQNVANLSTGTKMPRSDWNVVSKTEFIIPSDIYEQQRIGEFFEQLDATIALQKKLIEQKQQYKKAMLQRMFPQKGESVPKVRFKEFKGDWENATLEDIVDNIGTGKSKYSIHSKSEQTPYEILGSTSIIGYDNDFDYDGDFILTARVGANAGTLYKYAGKVKITDNTVFIKSENLNFIYYLLVNFELKKLAFGTGQPLIKSSELKKLELKIPMLKEEQKKIGTFFKQLDDTIALHQKRLEGYQNFKKTLLQRMFV